MGQTEEQLKEKGVPYNKGVFFFRANSRARALERIDGRIKILAHKDTDRVLGVHLIGPRAGDLIAEAAAAMSLRRLERGHRARLPRPPDAGRGGQGSRDERDGEADPRLICAGASDYEQISSDNRRIL